MRACYMQTPDRSIIVSLSLSRSHSLARREFSSSPSDWCGWQNNLKTTIYQFNLIGFLLPISSELLFFLFICTRRVMPRNGEFKNSTNFFFILNCFANESTLNWTRNTWYIRLSQFMTWHTLNRLRIYIFFHHLFYHSKMNINICHTFLHRDFVNAIKFQTLKFQREKNRKRYWEKPTLISTNFQINTKAA